MEILNTKISHILNFELKVSKLKFTVKKISIKFSCADLVIGTTDFEIRTVKKTMQTKLSKYEFCERILQFSTDLFNEMKILKINFYYRIIYLIP